MLLISIVKYLTIYADNAHGSISEEQEKILRNCIKEISQVINELDMEGYYDN